MQKVKEPFARGLLASTTGWLVVRKPAGLEVGHVGAAASRRSVSE